MSDEIETTTKRYPNAIGASVVAGLLVGGAIAGLTGGFALWLPIGAAVGLTLGFAVTRS